MRARAEKADKNARIYPCTRCGVMRSEAEGGTTFTVCDECWDFLAKQDEKRREKEARKCPCCKQPMSPV